MKTLILLKDRNMYFFQYLIKNEDYEIHSYYDNAKTNKYSLLFKFAKKMGKMTISFFLGNWKNRLNEFDKIICFDNGYDFNVSKYVKSKCSCDIFLFIWNQIDSTNLYLINDKKMNKIYTFNIEDSEKYNIAYAGPFFTNILSNLLCDRNGEAYFLGGLKNRASEIEQMRSFLETTSLNVDFRIVKNEKEFISYDDYIQIVKKSYVLVDVVNSNQTGLTLRVFEALFNKKKLITNNASIKKYNIYNPKNHYVTTHPDLDFETFLNSEYDESKLYEYKNEYDLQNWIKNFTTKGELR